MKNGNLLGKRREYSRSLDLRHYDGDRRDRSSERDHEREGSGRLQVEGGGLKDE